MDNNRKRSPREPQNKGGRQCNYKNIETSVNNPSCFNDDYESRAEDEIARQESMSEKKQRTGKRGNGWKDRPVVNGICTIKIA